MVEGLVQQLPFSSAERGQLRKLVQLRNLQMLLRQLRCLGSVGMWRDAQVPRIWSEQLKTLTEELRTLKEQSKELAVRALKNLALRALQRSLAVRALQKWHWACVRASLAWPSSAC